MCFSCPISKLLPGCGMTFCYGCLSEGVLNFREIFIQIEKKINDLTTFGVHLDVHTY
jgi:hypothetical protein